MKVKIVTSFNGDGYKQYGKRFVETFKEHWPKDVSLFAYYHDCELPEDRPTGENISYVNLNKDWPEFAEFRGKISGANGEQQGGYNYRLDAYKFCVKAFVLRHAFGNGEDDYLVWLDGDTFTHKDVDLPWLEGLLGDNQLVCLQRTGINYSETSFVAFKRDAMTASLVADLIDTYLSGEVFCYQEFHDGFIFERLLVLHAWHSLKVKSLTNEGYTGLEAFENSPLAARMHHLKGNRKTATLPQSNGPARYGQLAWLVGHFGPGVLLETGTWNGMRAMELAAAAFTKVDSFHYMGFDLFEEANEALDKVEFNSKSHNTLDAIATRLDGFAEEAKRRGKTFTYELHKGDTKKTLAEIDLSRVEFAYIDGGHSFETVKSDYVLLKHVPVIVFDDYFTEDSGGRKPAQEHCGVNELFEKENLTVAVLPSNDPVLGGGITHLAVLTKKELPKIGLAQSKQIRVVPQDCVPKEQLYDNIRENRKLIKKWVKVCKKHDEEALLVSGGLTTERDPDLVSDLAEGRKVFCVKHSLPTLLKQGIVPFGCVILDPRPVDGISTHGIKRTDLFAEIPKGTTFFVASMTHPSVTKLLLDRGANVVGWHAYSQGIAKLPLEKGEFWITEGTCAGWRAIGVSHCLGFRNLHFVGYDLNVDETKVDLKEKDEKGRVKYFKVGIGGVDFYTTGELLAAFQDWEKLANRTDIDIQMTMHGGGMCSALSRTVKKPELPDYAEIL